MKIACIDKTASDRISLQKRLDGYLSLTSDTVGHLSLLHFVILSRQEALFGSEPDAIVIGPGYSQDEAVAVCKELSEAFPTSKIFLLVEEHAYSLRLLRRFQQFCQSIFTLSESPIRLIHEISSSGRMRSSRGLVVAIDGAKGGVGTTSFVGAFAHAAQSLGKSSIVIDLSSDHVFLSLIEAPKRTSPEYSALLQDKILPSRQLVERCISVAPNGINVLLQPAGGNAIRQAWLHDHELFELSLSILDFLRDMYDLVLVDTARVDSILTYGILSRAEMRCVLSANEPASVFLAEKRLRVLREIPGDSQTKLIVNQLFQSGMRTRDILNALNSEDFSDGSALLLADIGFDSSAGAWAGTGNSFYTEANSQTKHTLNQCVQLLLSRSQFGAALHEEAVGITQRLIDIWNRFRSSRSQLALPWYRDQEETPLAPSIHLVASSSHEDKLYEAPSLNRSRKEESQMDGERTFYLEEVA